MSHRLAHYALLAAVLALTTLPNLGAPALWDVDEGVNAGCTKEMLESGSWIVPTFNGELRTAKPVMLYWLQRVSYLAFGVSEWSARFPAVVCSLGTILAVYELGRRMMSATVGLLAGVILATSIEFVKLAHAATPDAPLILFTTLTFLAVWLGHQNGRRWWFYPAALFSGYATLTKGPVGLALPGLAVLLYFAWNRELRRLWDRHLIGGLVIWLGTAVPWYAFVTSETRGAYLAFFRNENANRFLNPMEGHRGPVVYYLGAILAFFAPWSAFIGGAGWYGVKSPPVATGGLSRAHRFLLCWVGVYLVFFSVAATKLPNYIAPLYPPLAILTASFLHRWMTNQIAPAKWVMPTAAVGFGVVGLITGIGLLVVGGVVPVPAKGLRILPDLAPWAAVGLIPIVAAIGMLRTADRRTYLLTAAGAATLFVALMAAFPPVIVDRAKAPKQLVIDSGAGDTAHDIRLASLDYTQPSVTFYAGRRVERLMTATQAQVFLKCPLPAYLFVPEPVWTEQLAGCAGNHRIVARRYDFYRNCNVLVVTNR